MICKNYLMCLLSAYVLNKIISYFYDLCYSFSFTISEKKWNFKEIWIQQWSPRRRWNPKSRPVTETKVCNMKKMVIYFQLHVVFFFIRIKENIFLIILFPLFSPFSFSSLLFKFLQIQLYKKCYNCLSYWNLLKLELALIILVCAWFFLIANMNIK